MLKDRGEEDPAASWGEGLPSFVKTPEDQTGISGGVASFVCQAVGEPKPRITWMKKGKKVSSQRFEVSEVGGARGGEAIPRCQSWVRGKSQDFFPSLHRLNCPSADRMPARLKERTASRQFNRGPRLILAMQVAGTARLGVVVCMP
ncbi:hypothetical protein P4O66_002357 [Electrophorus voltai]|uniref:Ig-like domain-containing protein n=1 Tax=Electrophorus voltai TaxID=2609070 RepID=A0AAD8YZ72_9TELE|nr:hypothetical protein P4O66_002357 [Electrophorus voltai]